METEIKKLTPEFIKQFWPEACEREIEVRIELDALYKEQSIFGRGLDKYPRIAELDAELMQFIKARG
jgi:hypothetical protein